MPEEPPNFPSSNVTVTMPRERAESLLAGMADLLCWCAGFKAATRDDTTHHPDGVQATRDMRLAFMDAMGLTKELPF